MSKLNYFENKIAECIERKDYYEAHQVYRTLYNRLLARRQWTELQDILYKGACLLIEANEPTSAMDIAELYVEVLIKGEVSVSPELFSSLPSTLEKDTLTDGQKLDRRSKFLSEAIKWSTIVSKEKRYKKKGHASLHSCIANSLWEEGNYCSARSHFMLSDQPEKFAEFLVDFQRKHGDDNEKDLFVVQAIFQLLCARRLHTAYRLLREYCQKHPDINSEPPYNLPLLNFARFVILAIRAKKIEVFTRLLEIYDLSRDPSFMMYLDKIGQIYFGVPPPQEKSGFLGSFLKGLVKGNQTDDSAEVANHTAEEISDEEKLDEETEEEKAELDQILHASNASQIGKASTLQSSSLQATDDMELD